MVAVLVLGVVAEGAAWWLVASRGASVWTTLVPAVGVMGVAALLLGPPVLSRAVDPWVAAAAGAGAGAALYAATRVFVGVAGGWTAFRRHSAAMYRRQGSVPLGPALVLSVGVSAAGEELFWRGLFLPEITAAVNGRLLAGLVAWAAFVAANLPGRNLAIVAGAGVGGAVWTGLAVWTEGVLASLLGHALWTALMLSLPVVKKEAIR